MIDSKLTHPKDKIPRTIDKIYRSGTTTTSGGNISVINDNGNVWGAPSVLDKGTLRTSDIIVCEMMER